MKIKNKLALIGILILLIIIGFISYRTITGNITKDNTIKIGWIGPLTGPSAVLGMDSAVAAEMAIDEINVNGGINGKKVELIIEDDSYNAEKTIDSYNKLVNIDNVDIILINTYGGVFALAEKAKKDNVIIIDPLDCNNELTSLNDNVFCLATDSESIADVLANQTIKKDKVGILYFNSDSFMPLVKNYYIKKYNRDVVF